MFKCDECGSVEYSDIEGSGKDDISEFIDYWCAECESLIRIYEGNDDYDAQ